MDQVLIRREWFDSASLGALAKYPSYNPPPQPIQPPQQLQQQQPVETRPPRNERTNQAPAPVQAQQSQVAPTPVSQPPVRTIEPSKCFLQKVVGPSLSSRPALFNITASLIPECFILYSYLSTHNLLYFLFLPPAMDLPPILYPYIYLRSSNGVLKSWSPSPKAYRHIVAETSFQSFLDFHSGLERGDVRTPTFTRCSEQYKSRWEEPVITSQEILPRCVESHSVTR